jgi:hypothetical protein
MATLAKTELGTTDPLDICFGIDMIPPFAIDVGYEKNGNIFNVSINLFVVKLEASASYAVFVGMCGPRYAIKVFLEGATGPTTGGSNLSLVASNDGIDAGLLFGIDVTFSINFQIANADFHWVWDGWHSHISRSWNNLVNVNFSVSIDLFSILIEIIKKALGKEEGTTFKQVTNVIPSLSQAYGFFASSNDNFANGPYAQATPELTLPINIVPFLEDTPLAPIYALDESLSVIWGGFALGPQIGLGTPVKVQMKSVTVGSATYTGISNSGGNISGTSTSAADPNPTTMAIDFQHTTGFILTGGFFAQAWALKIFSVGLSINIDLLGLFGIQINAGPFDTTKSNTIGQNLNSSSAMTAAEPTKRVAFVLDPEPAAA